MAEEVGWGALGNAQGGWFAGAGLWVGEEQVIAPVVGVSEVRNKIKYTRMVCGEFRVSALTWEKRDDRAALDWE